MYSTDKKRAFLTISKTIKELSSLKENRTLHAIFIKDFYRESLDITDHLLDYNYMKTPLEPNMIFELNKNWKTVEDYTNALKSKYRVKVNKADKTSSDLTAKLFSENDLNQKKWQTRLHKTETRSSFSSGRLFYDRFST